jgi:hypothetical protein
LCACKSNLAQQGDGAGSGEVRFEAVKHGEGAQALRRKTALRNLAAQLLPRQVCQQQVAPARHYFHLLVPISLCHPFYVAHDPVQQTHHPGAQNLLCRTSPP